MNSLRKCVATILIVTTVIAMVIWALPPTAPHADAQHVLRYELAGTGTKTLYLFWPGVAGVAQIPLFTSSRERRQDERRDPGVDAISITWKQTE